MLILLDVKQEYYAVFAEASGLKSFFICFSPIPFKMVLIGFDSFYYFSMVALFYLEFWLKTKRPENLIFGGFLSAFCLEAKY